MAIHELAGDAEQTAVLITIVGWRDRKEATWGAWCTVSHRGTGVVHIRLPDGWRAMCRNVGLDDESPDTEGYLCTLAKLTFARQEGHLSCRKCGIGRGSAPTVCVRYESHDWLVAR